MEGESDSASFDPDTIETGMNHEYGKFEVVDGGERPLASEYI